MSEPVEECPHGLGDPDWCAVCKHGPSAAASEVLTPSAVVRARWPGTCPRCQTAFPVGAFLGRVALDHGGTPDTWICCYADDPGRIER